MTNGRRRDRIKRLKEDDCRGWQTNGGKAKEAMSGREGNE